MEFKHHATVKVVEEAGYTFEYDKVGRITYHEDPYGFWAKCDYDKVVNGRYSVQPLKVTHKYTTEYKN